MKIKRKKPETRITVAMLPIRHPANLYLSWDDVIEYATKCRDNDVPLQIRRRKKTRFIRKRRQELAKLVTEQEADQQDRRLRFDHAIDHDTD